MFISEKNLSPSLEDYLECILFLEKKNRVARVKDIAEFLRIKMPSVSGALRNLKEKGLIEYEKNSFIILTKSGCRIAGSVQKRHSILKRFLLNILLLSDKDAEEQACRIEHVVSPSTTNRIKNMTLFLEDSLLQKKEYSGDGWRKILSGDD